MSNRPLIVLALTLAAGSAIAAGLSGTVRSKRKHQRSFSALQNTRAFLPAVRYMWPSDAGALFPGGSSGSSAPADPTVAVGPTDILQAVNSQIRIYNKSGVLNFQQSAADFFAPIEQTTSPYSPKAYYDSTIGRYVLLFVESDAGAAQISNVLLAVSDDSDPHGSWFLYRIDSTSSNGVTVAWMDYPGLGSNDDAILITGNRHAFSDGSAVGSLFIVLDKSPLLTGSPLNVTSQVEIERNNIQIGFSGNTGSHYIFGAAWTSQTSLRLYGLRDPTGPSPVIYYVDRTVGTTPTALDSVTSTNGVQISTNGTVAMSASAYGDRMSVAYNTVSNGRSAVRFFSFDTTTFSGGTAAIVDVATISSPTLDYFQPSIRYNSHGDLAMMFSACSPSVTADVMVCGKTIGEPVAFFSTPVVAASADGDTYSQFDWGRNFSIDVDGTDDEGFWGTAMTVGADDLWTTAIENWYVSRTWPEAPTSGSWIRGFVQSGTASSLSSEDGDFFVAKAGPVLFAGEPPAQLLVDATAPDGTVLDFELRVVAKANTPGLSQRINLWNWTTSSWVDVGQQQTGLNNTAHVASAPGTLSDYLEPGTGAVRARLDWFQTGPVLLWPWAVSVDQVEWNIRTRQ